MVLTLASSVAGLLSAIGALFLLAFPGLSSPSPLEWPSLTPGMSVLSVAFGVGPVVALVRYHSAVRVSPTE